MPRAGCGTTCSTAASTRPTRTLAAMKHLYALRCVCFRIASTESLAAFDGSSKSLRRPFPSSGGAARMPCRRDNRVFPGRQLGRAQGATPAPYEAQQHCKAESGIHSLPCKRSIRWPRRPPRCRYGCRSSSYNAGSPGSSPGVLPSTARPGPFCGRRLQARICGGLTRAPVRRPRNAWRRSLQISGVPPSVSSSRAWRVDGLFRI